MSGQQHGKIDYLEFPSRDLGESKAFFQNAFGWSFQDYGEEYTAFSTGDMEGGFYHSDTISGTEKGAPLVIFYSEDLEETLSKVVENGGMIVKDVFPFPGGRRFHFTEPGGSEFAVWSDKGLDD